MRKVGQEGNGDTDPMGRGKTQGVSNVLQGSGAGDRTVRVREVGNFGINGE